MHSQRPYLRNGVDLQLQGAFEDQSWSTVVRLADKRFKMTNDLYYEVLRICAGSQLDDPAAKYGAVTALLAYVKDGTVIKDADGLDLLEWATQEFMGESAFSTTLGPLRVRAAKASVKDKIQVLRCLESCLLHWDLVSTQQIAALADKAFPSERAFLFWNVAVTHLLAISPQSPPDKKKLYGMLAQKQIERAAQAAEQTDDKGKPPSRSVQTEEEMLLLYEIVGTHGTTADFEKILSSPKFNPVQQLHQGRKETLMYAIKKLQQDENWVALFKVCRDCLLVENDKGDLTMQASDWHVWRFLIIAASHIQDLDMKATSTVQNLLLKLSKAANAKPIYRRNIMLARVSASFTLMEVDGPDAVDLNPESLRLRELLKYINDEAASTSCFDDVRCFAEQLDAHGIDYLAHKHFAVKETSGKIPELRKQLLALKFQYFAATCPQSYSALPGKKEKDASREKRFRTVYQASMSLHRHAASLLSNSSHSAIIDIQSEAALLAASCLVGLADQLPSSVPTTQSGQYLVQSLLLLQQQLASSPKHSKISLLLVQLHLRLGSVTEALSIWDSLAVKRTIMDSLAPLFYDRLSTVAPGILSPHTDAGWELSTSIRSHYDTSLKMRMPRRLTDAFRDESYSSVLRLPEYIENLRASCTRLMSLLEGARSERLCGVTDTDLFSDPRCSDIHDDTSMNAIIDYGSFPSWNHSAASPIYARLGLGPAPSNRRSHLSRLAETFQQTLTYTTPSFYKGPGAGSIPDQEYVIETMDRLANSFTKFLPGPSSDFTEAELHYFQVISLLSSLIPLCASRAAGLKDLFGQLTSAVVASLETQRDYLTALAAGEDASASISLLQSMHRIVLLCDTAAATKRASRWITGLHERSREDNRSAPGILSKEAAAQTRALAAAAEETLARCRAWIGRLTHDAKAGGGLLERGVGELAFAGDEGGRLVGVVADSTVRGLVASWRGSMASWKGVVWKMD